MPNSKTLADVAAAAGVSKMTASRALRGAPDVSADTRDRVRKLAEELGYLGNPLANSLSSQRSNLIGVVVPSLSNIVFAEVLTGIADIFAGTDYQTIFGVTDYDPEVEALTIQNMLSWRPAGLIVTGLDQDAGLRARLKAVDIPVVQIMDLDGETIDCCVGLSQSRAGADMARALLAAGRRKFGYVGCGLDRDTRAVKRLNGFAKVLEENELPLLGRATASGASSVVSGRKLTARLLAEHPDLDCIYFSNDDVAIGGLFHAQASGIKVPEQLTLAGFNGLEMLSALPAPIATTRTPRREIGQTAAEWILKSLTDDAEPGPSKIAFDAAIDLGL